MPFRASQLDTKSGKPHLCARIKCPSDRAILDDRMHRPTAAVSSKPPNFEHGPPPHRLAQGGPHASVNLALDNAWEWHLDFGHATIKNGR